LSSDRIIFNINVSDDLNPSLCKDIRMRCDCSALHRNGLLSGFTQLNKRVSITAPENMTFTHDFGQKHRTTEMATKQRKLDLRLGGNIYIC
jgi:hypothetical protein